MAYSPSDFDIFEVATMAGRMKATLIANSSPLLRAYNRAREEGVRYSVFFEAILTTEVADPARAFYDNLASIIVERDEARLYIGATENERDAVHLSLTASALRTYLSRTQQYRLAFFDECFNAGLERPFLLENESRHPIPV